MTLIALVVRNGDEAIAFSDIAISRPGRDQQEADDLPLRGIIRANEQRSENSIVSVEHKIVILGKHLILWAGDLESAKYLCHFLYNDAILYQLNADTFLSLARRGLGRRMESLSLIYCEHIPNGIAFVHHRCHRLELGGATIICAGTGTPALSDEVRNLAARQGATNESNFRITTRIVSGLLHREVFEPDFYDDSFGHTYEFALSDRNGFYKPNYNTLFYSGNQRGFGLTQFIDIRGVMNSTIIRNFASSESAVVLEDWPYLMMPHMTVTSITVCPDFLRPRIHEAHLVETIKQAALSQEASTEGLLTFVFLMRVNDARRIVTCEQAIFRPSVINLGNNGYYRAWFRRLVESYYTGRRYQPPPSKMEFYAAFFGEDYAGSEFLR